MFFAILYASFSTLTLLLILLALFSEDQSQNENKCDWIIVICPSFSFSFFLSASFSLLLSFLWNLFFHLPPYVLKLPWLTRVLNWLSFIDKRIPRSFLVSFSFLVVPFRIYSFFFSFLILFLMFVNIHLKWRFYCLQFVFVLIPLVIWELLTFNFY